MWAGVHIRMDPGGRGALRIVLVAACLTSSLVAVAPASEAAPLNGASADVDTFCSSSATGYSDKTGAANDATPSDVTLARSAVPSDPNAVYIGFDQPFSKIVFNIGTGGTGEGSVLWKYFAGNTLKDLAVVDSSTGFSKTGIQTVTFTPPTDWTIKQVNAACPERFFVKITTGDDYDIAPAATQISGVVYNLRLKVIDDALRPVAGLAQAAFAVSAATDTAIKGFREAGAGTGLYDLALRTDAADVSYEISVTADGYVTSAAKTTPDLSTSLTDLSASPITLQAGFKVTGITSEANTPVSGAAVTTGNGHGVSCAPSGGAYYCPVPLAHTGLEVRVVGDGYVTNTEKSFSLDRTAAADPQRTVAVTGVLFTARIAVAGMTSLTGVAWEKKVGTGEYSGVAPDAKVGNVAYLAVSPSEQDVVIRASKQTGAATTGDPFTTSATAQLVKTIQLVAGEAIEPAPTPAPLGAPTDVVFEGVEAGVLHGTRAVVRWTVVPGATEYVLFANDGDTFDPDQATEVATALAPPLEVTLPEGRKTYTLAARGAGSEVRAAPAQEILVAQSAGEPDTAPVAPPFAVNPIWVAAFLAGVLLLFPLWVVAPSVVALRPRPGTTPTRGFAWKMRHCGACARALPRGHRLMRSLHACVVTTPTAESAAPAPTPQVPAIGHEPPRHP